MKKAEFAQCFSLAARIGLALTVGLSLLTTASRVHAQIVQYSDRTSFLAAAAVGLTTFTFDGYTETNSSTNYPHGLTVQGITFTTDGDGLYVDDPGSGGGNPFFNHQYLDADYTPLHVALPIGTTAFGAEFSNFGVRNASTLTAIVNGQTFTFGAPGGFANGSTFFGVISHTPITSLVISGGDIGPALDYVSFGPPPQPVHEEWNRRWDGPTHQYDAAAKVAVDQGGDVFVAGYSDATANGGGSSFRLVKYAANGTELWNQRYEGPAHSYGYVTGLGLDAKGDAYVTGYTPGTSGFLEYATLKYDPDGTLLWERRYANPNHLDAAATALAVEADGTVYVTGYARDSDPRRKPTISVGYVTLKYNSDGTRLWAARYDLSVHDAGFFTATVATDPTGHVFVGASNDEAGIQGPSSSALLKYSSSGHQLWVKPSYFNSSIRALAADPAGNVYITGTVVGFSQFPGYVTAKYSGAGKMLWETIYTPAFTAALATALAVDGAGNTLVTGSAGTLKFSPTGVHLWTVDSGAGVAVATDAEGGVYVASQAFTVHKYGPNGRPHWNRTFESPGGGPAHVAALVLDDLGNVYAAGWTADGATNEDMRTVKYSQ